MPVCVFTDLGRHAAVLAALYLAVGFEAPRVTICNGMIWCRGNVHCKSIEILILLNATRLGVCLAV
jgi:hypothetical protein